MPRIPKKEIEKDLKRYSDIEALTNTDGGKHLKKRCLDNIVSAVDTIATQFQDLTHIQMIAIAAKLNERLNMYRVLSNAKDSVDVTREALEEALNLEDED